MTILQSDFRVLNPKKTYTHHSYYQSWYSSIFLKKRSSDDNEESCCITFQVRKGRENKKYLVLGNILMPNRFSSHDVMTHLKNLNNDFTNNTLKPLPSLYEQTCVIVPANENEYNTFASQAQKDNLPIQRLFIESHGGDLEGLLDRAMNIAKNNNFCLVLDSKDQNVFRPMDDRFLSLIIRYPSSDAYALAYAWAQGIIFGERNLYLFEDDRKSGTIKSKVGFYGVDV